MREALVEVPRERHAPLDAILESLRDAPVPLDREGLATVSAFHAYACTFEAASIGPGTRVLDLGAGTGYGTALLSRMVGPSGFVRSVEIDPALVEHGLVALGDLSNGELVVGNAFEASAWEGGPWDAVVVGFCVDAIPALFLESLAGAVLVVPRKRSPEGSAQILVRIRVVDGCVEEEIIERVVYVPARTSAPVRPLAEPVPAKREGRVRLPLAR